MGLISLLILRVCSTVLPLFHAVNAIFTKRPPKKELTSPIEKGISILIPCYNEERILQTTIEGLKELQYTNHEVVFINDGSSDQTLQQLDELLELDILDSDHEDNPNHLMEQTITNDHSQTLSHKNKILTNPIINIYRSKKLPNFYVIHKENGGKSDALNVGINFAAKDYVLTLDADSVLEKMTLQILNDYLTDSNLIAAGGTVHILQAKFSNFMRFEDIHKTTSSMPEQQISHTIKKLSMKISWVILFQILEYLKGFYIYKMSLNKVKALTVLSGSFAVFRKDILLKVEGFRETLGEDIDITLRIQKLIHENPEYKMKHIPEAICYTECPESWSDLYKQRIRWQKAFIDSIAKHGLFFLRSVLYRPLSFFLLVDAFMIGIISVYVTYSMMAWIIIDHRTLLGWIGEYMLIYFGLSFCSQLLYTGAMILVTLRFGCTFQHKTILFGTIIFDLVFYRFVTCFFTIWGTLLYFFSRNKWNKVARTGRSYEIATVDPYVTQREVVGG